MIKKESYPAEVILPLIGDGNPDVNLDGDFVGVSSLRMRTFKEKGTRCTVCGIEGTFFTKEKHHERDGSYHLNLYGILPNGGLRLMTKDHSVPKSKGGPDYICNTQTMCEKCNNKKDNKLYMERTNEDGWRGKTKMRILYIDSGNAYML